MSFTFLGVPEQSLGRGIVVLADTFPSEKCDVDAVCANPRAATMLTHESFTTAWFIVPVLLFDNSPAPWGEL